MHEQKKRAQIRSVLAEYGRGDIAVAFSGGVDSSLLLYLAMEAAGLHGKTVYALTADTVLHPAADRQIAAKVAKSAGAVHKILFVDELRDGAILNNPVNRCYLCKKQLFLEFLRVCAREGIPTLLEGSNGDDLQVYRPGIQAIRELQVVSPLAEAGLTKAEVRRWAGELKIPTAERPSTPCMATRLPYGAKLSAELLAKIEKGEELLQNMGYAKLRLRIHGEVTRIEVPSEDFSRLLEQRETIVEELQALGFRYLTLDLQGLRSGSMDEYLPLKNSR